MIVLSEDIVFCTPCVGILIHIWWGLYFECLLPPPTLFWCPDIIFICTLLLPSDFHFILLSLQIFCALFPRLIFPLSLLSTWSGNVLADTWFRLCSPLLSETGSAANLALGRLVTWRAEIVASLAPPPVTASSAPWSELWRCCEVWWAGLDQHSESWTLAMTGAAGGGGADCWCWSITMVPLVPQHRSLSVPPRLKARSPEAWPEFLFQNLQLLCKTDFIHPTVQHHSLCES